MILALVKKEWPCSKNARLAPSFKQFVVTNCSKEQPDSIVTKTLKNGFLIPIVTSKESHFNADFKYTSFIKISYTHHTSLRKFVSFQKIGGNTP